MYELADEIDNLAHWTQKTTLRKKDMLVAVQRRSQTKGLHAYLPKFIHQTAGEVGNILWDIGSMAPGREEWTGVIEEVLRQHILHEVTH